MRRHDTRRYLFYLFIAHEAAKTDTNKHSKPNTLPQSTKRNTTHITNQTKNRKGIKTIGQNLICFTGGSVIVKQTREHFVVRPFGRREGGVLTGNHAGNRRTLQTAAS